MKERIEKWLEDHTSNRFRAWREEFQYTLILVLFWGFREMIEERSKIKFVMKDVEEALSLTDPESDSNTDDFYSGPDSHG